MPRTHWTPSPCGRLSRPPWWGATPTTTTGPPPRPGGNSGRCACPEPTNSGSTGTAGTLPTFTHRPVGRVGAQLYPGDIAARHRNMARSLTRPSDKRTDKTALSEHEDRASRQPIAGQFRGCCPVSGLQALVRLLRLSALLADPARWRRTVPTSPRAACRPTPHLRRQCCPPASPDRYGGRGRGLSPHPVIWRLVAQARLGRPGVASRSRALTPAPSGQSERLREIDDRASRSSTAGVCGRPCQTLTRRAKRHWSAALRRALSPTSERSDSRAATLCHGPCRRWPS